MKNFGQEQGYESKLFGAPRPLAGAIIGVLIFLLILIPLKILQYATFMLFFLTFSLELPGRLVISALNTFAKTNPPESIGNILRVTISAIPPGILGWLIGSDKKSTRTAGIVLVVIYLCFLLVVGTFLALKAI